MQQELESQNKVVDSEPTTEELSFTKFKSENAKPAEKSTLDNKPTKTNW